MSDSTGAAWPELELPKGVLSGARIASNALVRSAFFSTLDFAGGAQRPRVSKPLSLGAIKPYVVMQIEGVRLSQSDAGLFYWLLARAYRSGTPHGAPMVFFTRGEALIALGRTRGGKSDLLLDESLSRLADARFIIEYLGETNQIRLVAKAERADDHTKPYDMAVSIDASAAKLLEGGEWVVLHDAVRKRLASDPLASGLHAFYQSHKTAYPMLPSTLKVLMGRESMQDSKWLFALKKSLSRVLSATGWLQCGLEAEGRYAGKVVVVKGLSTTARGKGKAAAAMLVDAS